MPSNPATATGKVLSEEVLREMLKLKSQTVEEAAPVPKEPDFIRETVVIKQGYKEFKDVFGFKAPSGLEHAIKVFEPEDWDIAVRGFIPKLDEGYIWPKENTEVAVMALMNGDKTLIIGPTGSGKSSLIKNLCALLNIPFIRVNFFNQVEYSSVFGMPKIVKGTLTYSDGPICVLARHGGVLCLDEFSSASSDITMSLQSPLEDGGNIYLPDYPSDNVEERTIVPHHFFRLVATDNTELQGDTTGKHSGTNVQNTATLDRFGTVIRHDYLTKDHERKMLKKIVPTIPDTWVTNMLQLSDLIRKGYKEGQINLTMSPRTLINWAKKSVYWADPKKALQQCFIDKLISDDRKVVDELVIKVYGK